MRKQFTRNKIAFALRRRHKIDNCKKVTGFSSVAEMQAFENGYNAGIDSAIDKIKRWDGAKRNSFLYELLYQKAKLISHKANTK